MTVKTSLVRVCRQWKDIGTPFLYETVRLKRSSALQSFARSVKYSATVAQAEEEAGIRSARHYGYFTTRLNISLYPWHRSRHADSKEVVADVESLDSLLTPCENVQYLRAVSFHGRSNTVRLTGNAKFRLKNFHQLDLDTVNLGVVILTSARNSDNLKVLILYDYDRRYNAQLPLISDLSFPALHTLHIFNIETLPLLIGFLHGDFLPCDR
jgi:hypothetical protein